MQRTRPSDADSSPSPCNARRAAAVQGRSRHAAQRRSPAASSLSDALASALRSVGMPQPDAGYGSRWWNDDAVAVVTGANKGIGYEAARLLASQGVHTVVAARNAEAGAAAASKIAEATGNSRVQFARLDIADHASVAGFAQWAAQELGHIEFLVNKCVLADLLRAQQTRAARNLHGMRAVGVTPAASLCAFRNCSAGMAYKGPAFGAEEAEVTLGTNFRGTLDVCQSLKHLISDGGRIVNVCRYVVCVHWAGAWRAQHLVCYGIQGPRQPPWPRLHVCVALLSLQPSRQAANHP